MTEARTSPYYAVIFSSSRRHSSATAEEYEAAARRMLELAAQQPGYLGVESVRGEDDFGITVSYWQTLEDVKAWRQQAEHRAAQEMGRTHWYESFRVRVCRVERDYDFAASNAVGAPRILPMES